MAKVRGPRWVPARQVPVGARVALTADTTSRPEWLLVHAAGPAVPAGRDPGWHWALDVAEPDGTTARIVLSPEEMVQVRDEPTTPPGAWVR